MLCSKRRSKVAAKRFLIKTMRKHGAPKIITTDKLPSYHAAFREIGVADRQLCGGRSNNNAKIHTPCLAMVCLQTMRRGHFDDESERCSTLKRSQRSKSLTVITTKYTTTSIMLCTTRDISILLTQYSHRLLKVSFKVTHFYEFGRMRAAVLFAKASSRSRAAGWVFTIPAITDSA